MTSSSSSDSSGGESGLYAREVLEYERASLSLANSAASSAESNAREVSCVVCTSTVASLVGTGAGTVCVTVTSGAGVNVDITVPELVAAIESGRVAALHAACCCGRAVVTVKPAAPAARSRACVAERKRGTPCTLTCRG